jgi:capsular polysaccharide biosynthesis protein
MKRIKETGLTTGLEATNVHVVERATTPTFPIRPRTPLILGLSVILGLGLGIGLAFVAESFDNRIRSAEDVERALGVPVIGFVPIFKTKKKSA